MRGAKHFTGFGLAALLIAGCGERVHEFEGVEGPAEVSEIFQPVPARPQDYDHGATSRLAIWLTHEDSHWLALANGLKSKGIPFRITTDYEEAMRHDVMMVYPYISGRDLPVESFSALQRYTKDGGTLIATNVLGGGLQGMFGFESISESKDKAFLSIDDAFPETTDFEDKGLTAIKIGNAKDVSANPGTNSYLGVSAETIATYEDGNAAIIARNYGRGRAYAFGIDIGQILAKGHNRRQVKIADSYANRYRPTVDALLIMLENIYQQNQENAVTIGTVPDGKNLSFILSHDIDYSKSLENAVLYAEHQKEEGIQGTYFIQTKYVKDYYDAIFMNEAGAAYTQTLEALGAEIASHSVSHAEDLWDFPFGTGTETYPDYVPFVENAYRTRDGSIMGELRVSKFLLDHFARESEVVSFRPGYLSNPMNMPEALASSGYKYSSSVTANISFTHYPFQLTYGRGFDALTPVYEFPITIEDELPPAMIDRLDEAKNVARNIAKIGGIYVVLIHTDAVDSRLEFQKEIVDEVRPYAWMGSMRQFGDWWVARDQVDVDIERGDNETIITLDAPEPISGLTLTMSKCHDVAESSEIVISCLDGNYLLGELSGQTRMVLKRSP